MAISEQRYAAEFLTKSGDAVKFDDIGCMLRYLSEHGVRNGTSAIFVRDFSGNSWLDATRASYVQAEGIPSPMASGLAAFSANASAATACARFHGRLLRYEELWKLRL